jgi:hypothetical protein
MLWCSLLQMIKQYKRKHNISYITTHPIIICMIKKFIDQDVVTMHLLQKKFIKKHTCVDLHLDNSMFLTIPW